MDWDTFHATFGERPLDKFDLLDADTICDLLNERISFKYDLLDDDTICDLLNTYYPPLPLPTNVFEDDITYVDDQLPPTTCIHVQTTSLEENHDSFPCSGFGENSSNVFADEDILEEEEQKKQSEHDLSTFDSDEKPDVLLVRPEHAHNHSSVLIEKVVDTDADLEVGRDDLLAAKRFDDPSSYPHEHAFVSVIFDNLLIDALFSFPFFAYNMDLCAALLSHPYFVASPTRVITSCFVRQRIWLIAWNLWTSSFQEGEYDEF